MLNFVNKSVFNKNVVNFEWINYKKMFSMSFMICHRNYRLGRGRLAVHRDPLDLRQGKGFH